MFYCFFLIFAAIINTSNVHFPLKLLRLIVSTPVLSSTSTFWNNQTFHFKTKLLFFKKTKTSHSLTYVFGGLQDDCQAQFLAEKTHRTQYIFTLMTVIFTVKRYKTKLLKRKGTQGKHWRKKGAGFQQSFPSRVTQNIFNCYDNICEMLFTKEAHQNLNTQSFYKVLVTQAPSLDCTQTADFQKDSKCLS